MTTDEFIASLRDLPDDEALGQLEGAIKAALDGVGHAVPPRDVARLQLEAAKIRKGAK